MPLMISSKAAPHYISRRNFLKACGLMLGGLAIMPVKGLISFDSSPLHYSDPFSRQPEQDQGMLGRIASIYGLDVYAKPDDTSEIVGKRLRDQVVHISEEVRPPETPDYSPWRWYRVWGGYLHSAHIQKVTINLNQPVDSIPETGTLAEVTVPYSTALQYNALQGWIPWRGSRLYEESTHWLTGLVEGPDKEPWYQITSELAKSEIYYAPARHFRLFDPKEFSPIHPEVPLQNKQIEISISQQTLKAYEYGKEILSTLISSGVPTNVPKGSLPTATPKGEFRIYAKQPSKHMGSVAGGAEVETQDGFSLPGVPWTSFFKSPGGYALHGTYWHNNFGMQMSHGCVNMRNQDAKFIFRWCSPAYQPDIKNIADWEQTGYGTTVIIY
jgi:hypothetical protein